MVVAGGGGEGEAADAAGEGAVVAAAAAGVGERLVGLLHLDEAARVLPGGEGSSGEVGHLGLDVSTNCCCSALIWSEAKSGAGFLCFFEMERKPSIQALDPACVEKICVESFSCPPLVAFIVLLLLLPFLFPGFYYFIYFRIALAAQFILFYFSSSFLPQRSHAHVWL